MIGMTPAWFTRSGRKLARPCTCFRPTVRWADWMGIFLTACWTSMITAVVTNAMAPRRAFSGDLVDALGDHRHQLHDDRGVDVGIKPHRDDAEGKRRAAGEEAEEPEQSLRVEELHECNLAGSGNRHVGEDANQK